VAREDRHTKFTWPLTSDQVKVRVTPVFGYKNLVWSKALSVFAGSQKRLDHFGVYEVAVERVQLVEPEIEP
jgi:hypothetical protein